ncbi:MAG: isoprenylcysteine carboxylmethyltransferase family protein [Phycisphaerae bacterium]|nr:isoprenylcysteine carboxylmethyltransferase family protein [Phycisphaerae bacterium]
MVRKIAKGIFAAMAIVILPMAGNTLIFGYPQVWILIAIGMAGSILQPDYQLSNDKTNARDRGTEAQIIWSVYVSQLLAVLEAGYLRYPASMAWDAISLIALAFMIGGLTVRTWAVYTLGQYFTMQLKIHDEHRIIRTGPYKYLCHPSYSGAFLTYFGTTVFLHSWFSMIIAGIILSFAFLRRMHFEEKMLIDRFGDEYRDYCKSTKKVMPWLW